MQIYSEKRLKQGTKIEMEGKIYSVVSCLDNEYFGNGIGYLLTVKYLEDRRN